MPKGDRKVGDRKVIVVTGASRGIGRVMVEGFSALGHAVAGCARDSGKLDKLSEGLKQPHVLRALDVSDDEAVKKFAVAVIEQLGAPDLLVNNAALINKPAPLWRVSREEFDSLIDVNVKGVVNMIRHFVPYMVERKKGVIVNLSSGWGRSTSPEVAPYCATKYAVEGLSKSLAEELRNRSLRDVVAIEFRAHRIRGEVLFPEARGQEMDVDSRMRADPLKHVNKVCIRVNSLQFAGYE